MNDWLRDREWGEGLEFEVRPDAVQTKGEWGVGTEWLKLGIRMVPTLVRSDKKPFV